MLEIADGLWDGDQGLAGFVRHRSMTGIPFPKGFDSQVTSLHNPNGAAARWSPMRRLSPAIAFAGAVLVLAATPLAEATEEGGVIPPVQSGTSSGDAANQTLDENEVERAQRRDRQETEFIANVTDGFLFFIVLMLGMGSFLNVICLCSGPD